MLISHDFQAWLINRVLTANILKEQKLHVLTYSSQYSFKFPDT